MLSEIIDAISTVGFPVVAVIACAWFIYKNAKQAREDGLRREERLTLQIEKFGESMDAFNLTLNNINNRLTDIEEKIDVKN